MALLSESDKNVVRQFFEKNVTSPVTLIFFTQTLGCDTCRDAEALLEEVAALSPNIKLRVLNLAIDTEEAEKFGVDMVPALIITGAKNYGVRYFGLPAGYEFRSLMEDIADVSRGSSGLKLATKDFLKTLQRKVHLQVFVTPTCPYCPQMVRLAHQAAIESDLVTGDMIEAIEFPDLAARYSVMGVPKTVINGKYALEGAVPEDAFTEWLRKVVTDGAPQDDQS